MYQFILSDLHGTPYGEITNAKERQISLPFMRIPTASFKVKTWHPLSDALISTDCLLKVYRKSSTTNDLIFHGPVISAQETGDNQSQSIAVNATGPMWRLSKRIIPGSKLRSGVGYGSTASPMDLGQIAQFILDDCNAEQFTGIISGGRVPSISGSVGPWWLKNAAEAITELTTGLNSFEFVVTPSEPTDVGGVGGWPKIGQLDIAAEISGIRSNVIFEYGTAKANIASYERQITQDTILNKAVISVQGWPDGTTNDIIERQDTTSIIQRGLFQEAVNDAGVIDASLRTSIADEHVAIRKNPRQVITFKPVTNAKPEPFKDYLVGDQVRARAVVRNSVRFDGLFRVWGISVSLDDNGNESVELELVMP